MELNRMDYVYMKLLKKKKCTSFFESMTLREIMEVTNTARVTTYKKLSKLVEYGYVQKGCKSAQADTYFISAKGLRTIEKGVIEDD